MNAHSTESDALLTPAEVAAIRDVDPKTLVSGALQVTGTGAREVTAVGDSPRGEHWAPRG